MRCQEIQILSDGRAGSSQIKAGPLSPGTANSAGRWCEEFQYGRRGGIEGIHIITGGESQLTSRVHTLSPASAKVFQTRQLELVMRSGGKGEATYSVRSGRRRAAEEQTFLGWFFFFFLRL